MASVPWGPRNRSRSAPVNTDRSLGPYRSMSEVGASVTSPLGPVLLRLTHPDRVQELAREVRVETLPEHTCEVLRRRDDAAQPVDVDVQVAVIDVGDDQLLHQRRQLAQIENVTGVRIDLA